MKCDHKIKLVKFILLLAILLIVSDSFASTDTLAVENRINPNLICSGYEFFRSDDTTFYSAHLIFYDNKIPVNYFLVNLPSKEKYFSDPEDFIMLSKMGTAFPLMNFDFPFLLFKYNVSRFIHPGFAIKFLYLVHSLGGDQMISDAMRKSEEQLLYLRRGWTDVESSPHMYGLAGDMVRYSVADTKHLLSKVDQLDVRYLEHGSRGNRHIHLQDNEIWKHIKNEFTNTECKALNDSLCNKTLPVDIKKSSEGFVNYTNFSIYSFENKTEGTLRLVFTDYLGRPAGEIRAGVFSPGHHEILYKTDFLKEGAYTLRIYFNYEFLAAIPVFAG
jgi:hypothetical protein